MIWIAVLGFVVLMVVVIVFYLLPSDPAVKKKKREKVKKPALAPEALPVDDGKDWKAIAERWEKNNQSLQETIDKFKTGQKKAEQLHEEHASQVRALTEKLDLEKSWRQKEQETLEKFKHHEKDLKDQIYRTETDLEKEHSNRLRLERELQDIKIKTDGLMEEKRQLSIMASSQQSTLEANARELRELKRENSQLKEKREDVQWVTKGEFDEVKKVLAAKEKELARLKAAPDASNG